MNLKKIVRTDHCLNCETPLHIESDNFCPNCGQLNNTKKETAFGLVKELVEEFLHLDAKVFQSLKPLLFNPGFLTVDYINGRRARYFHPVRMFLTISVIMFIVGGLTGGEDEGVKKNNSASALADGDIQKKEVDSVYMFDTEKQKLEKVPDTSTNENDITWSFGEVQVVTDSLQKYLDAGIVDPKALMDTFKVEKTFVNTIFFHQMVKTQLAGKTKLIDYYKHKLPWLLFSLMPVFAFVLYLFYIRRKIFFVDHLIHAFHLHSATFVIIALENVLSVIFPFDTGFIYLYIPIYYFISLKKVYKQSTRKTIFKGIGIGFFYFMFGIIVLSIIAAIMFLMILKKITSKDFFVPVLFSL